jgi:hypothetical protein
MQHLGQQVKQFNMKEKAACNISMISAAWLINNFNCLDIHYGLAQFLFLCNQHGQYSQDASTKDINSLAN